MNPDVGTFPEFRRASVADQAAAALRESIRQGVWGDLLPGEHELARRLNISRPTLRAALARLAEDGVIEVHRGRRTRVSAAGPGSCAEVPPTVCLVVPARREAQGLADHPVITQMRALFAVQGVGWEEVFDHALARRDPEVRLSQLVHNRRHVCWLLLSASAALQRWFEVSRLPTLVLGSCHDGIRLPSVDLDYYAIGWHAAGCLAKSGHRRVAIVLPHRALAGDLACLHGLVDYSRRLREPIAVTEVVAGPTRASFVAALTRLLARPERPTAIFCIHVAEMLLVLAHVLRSGLRVPEDLSLLCRETIPAVDAGLPELTRYGRQVVRQANLAVRIARSMLAGQHVPARAHMIMPTFLPGGTLAPPPSW